MALKNNVATTEDAISTTTEAVPTMRELEGVRYIGLSDVRSISIAELERAGVSDAKVDLVWSAENEFLVPASDLNAATRDLLATQSDFDIV